MRTDDFMRFLAAWELVHETADEGLKAAIARGGVQEAGEMDAGPSAFVDGLAAMVDEEKELLKRRLTSDSDEGLDRASTAEELEALRFEVAQLRGRVESMGAVVDSIAERLIKP